jgi:hypothetical protein
MGRSCTDKREDLHFYSYFNLGARLRSVVKVTSWPFYPRERMPVPISQEFQWAAGLVWPHIEEKNLLPLSGFEPPAIQSVQRRYTDRSISTRHFWTSEDLNNFMCIREISEIPVVILF